MHKRTLFILPVIAGVLCLAFPVVLEQLGTPRLLPDGVDSLLGMVGMTVLCAALNILRRLSAPACRREQKALHDERNTAIQNKARAISGDITMLAVLLHHVLGLVAGYAIARVFRFNEAKTRALSLEVGLQNSGLSCTLAASAFPGTLAVLPCVLATVVHQVVGPVVANLFAARDTKPAKAPAGSAEAAEA